MYLTRLNLVNFKNRAEADLSLHNGVNCFTGNNGAGKTNILDAVYYLSFTKSYFNPIDSQNITHGQGFFVIEGNFEAEGKRHNIYCGVKRGEKKIFKRNKKKYDKFSDHIGLLPLVFISPADEELIYGGSEVRRKFLDGVISQFDKSYLEHLINYQKALSQRNKLLKTFAETGRRDQDAIEVWDMQLIQHGTPVYEARKTFAVDFIPVFEKYYRLLGSDREKAKVNYKSKLNDDSFENLLKTAQNDDARKQFTTVGTHKDDLSFTLNNYSLKKTGSQGQKKSFLTALKLAQFEFIKNKKNTSPILLLDDIFDKLDKTRVKALMNIVSGESFGQVLVTDTSSLRIAEMFDNFETKIRLFNVTDKEITIEK